MASFRINKISADRLLIKADNLHIMTSDFGLRTSDEA